MITQKLVLEGGYPDGVWTCAGCPAELTEGLLTHYNNCTEMSHHVTFAAGARAERAKIKAQLAEYRFHDRCTDPDCPEVYHCAPALIGDSDGEG